MTPGRSYRIGGEQEIDLEQFDAPVFEHCLSLPKPFLLWTDTGRSAICLALQEIKHNGCGKLAWLPAYCCSSVVAPFIAQGFVIRFYSMGADLKSPCGLPSNLPDGAVFLFIHYFGFRNEAIIDWLADVPRNGAVFILEDCVQASLNGNVGETGDYAFTSYRKFLAQPDGALLASNTPCTSRLSTPDETFVSGRAVGKLLRSFSQKEDFLGLITETEHRLDTNHRPAAISWLSNYLMQRTDIAFIRQARQKNWSEISHRLVKQGLIGKWLTPLFTEQLDDGGVPLGFPVLVHGGKRDPLRNHLRSKNIYCPVHWPLDHLSPQEGGSFFPERTLSLSMLTLPIDQKLDSDSIDYFVECIKDFFKFL